MLLREIHSFLKKLAPPPDTDWPQRPFPIGNLAKYLNRGIRKVGIAHDFSLKVLVGAIKNKIPLLIVLNGTNLGSGSILPDYQKNRLSLILQHKISILQLSPSISTIKNGLNEKILNWIDIMPSHTFHFALNEFQPPSFGVVCLPRTKTVKLEYVLQKFKRFLSAPGIKSVGSLQKAVTKICVAPNSLVDASMINSLYDEDCDCLITGQVAYETAIVARELNIAVIIIPPYAFNTLILKELQKLLALEFPRDEVTYLDSQNPFTEH